MDAVRARTVLEQLAAEDRPHLGPVSVRSGFKTARAPRAVSRADVCWGVLVEQPSRSAAVKRG